MIYGKLWLVVKPTVGHTFWSAFISDMGPPKQGSVNAYKTCTPGNAGAPEAGTRV